MCWNVEHKAALVGAGCLGTALIGYQDFKEHGFNISIVFDNDEKKVGKTIYDVKVFNIKDAEKMIKAENIKIAILAVPSESSQSVTDILLKAGIKGIWNFTNRKINTPDDVAVWREDLSSGYAMLSYMMNNNGSQC